MKLENFKLSDCPVPILQDEWEFKMFLEMYIDFAPKNVVEIGSFYGGTLWHWIKYNELLKRIMSIDLSIPPSDNRYNEMNSSKKLWPCWIKNEISFNFFEGSSHDPSMINAVKSRINKEYGLCDMLFIDGDHLYNSVKKDWNNYRDLVRPGGWIVFHDSVGIPDVKQLVTEIKAENKYKTIEISSRPDGWGITIIII